MAQKINQELIMQALDWGYDKALNGAGALDSAYELATAYLQKNENKEAAVSSLVNWQMAKCGTSGFISGLGGLLTMPVAIPANISSVLFVQLRMIAAIAVIGNYEPKSDQVRALVYTCLAGKAGSDILKGVGIKLGQKITEKMIQGISTQLITRINQAVGFRLITKFGQTGLVNFGKAIPLAGGIIGGAFDATSTKIIGKTATNLFICNSLQKV
jgi:hypothetical protein